jgi:hypothetical protein
MGRHNYTEELDYNIAKGVDSTSPASLVQPGFARDARNVDVGTTGGWSKRKGAVRQLTTPWSTLSIRSGVEYKMLDGTTQRLFYGTDDLSTASFGKLNVSGGIDEIQTGLDATKRLAFAQIEDRLYAFNGDSVNTPFVYEGAAVRELGLDRPLTAPTATASTGGSKIEGSYIFAYTYAIRDAGTGALLAESSPSDFTTLELTQSDNRAILGVVASSQSVSGTRELIIRIWSTVANGSVLFLEDEIPNTTGDYNADKEDDALATTQLELDNSRLSEFDGYTKAKFPVIARNRLFVFHESRNEARFSKIGQEGPLIESFPALNRTPCEGIYGSTDKVVGGGQINGIPVVLKERSIGKFEEVGLPDITKAEDNVYYTYREISQTIGAVGHFAQSQVRDELCFMGVDNVYATDGNTVRPIASFITQTIRNLDFRPSKKTKVSMVNDTKYKRLYIQVFETQAAAEPTFTLVGNYEQYPDFRWTFYGAGTNATTHPGFRAGSFFQFTNNTDGSLETYYGNSNGDGQYYKMNTGDSDDDAGTEVGIYCKLISRPYSMGSPLTMKLFKNIKIFAEAADETYQLKFKTIYDLSVEEEFAEDFVIPGVGNKWDEHNWTDDAETESDPLIWAGPALAELTYDPHRKAKFMQLVFMQTDKDAPATLLGWGVSGSMFSGL